MNHYYQKFGLVMGANVEAVMFAMGAYYGGEWLNQNYPKDEFNWFTVTTLLALILIAHSWYVLFRQLIKSDKKQ